MSNSIDSRSIINNRHTKTGLLPFIKFAKEQILNDNQIDREMWLTLLATLIKVEESLSVDDVEKAKKELLLGFGLTVPPKQKRNFHTDEDIWTLVMYYKKHYQNNENYLNPLNNDCPKIFGELSEKLGLVRNTFESRFTGYNERIAECYNEPILNNEYLVSMLINNKEYLEETFQLRLPQLKK
jgi:hypothetical protein